MNAQILSFTFYLLVIHSSPAISQHCTWSTVLSDKSWVVLRLKNPPADWLCDGIFTLPTERCRNVNIMTSFFMRVMVKQSRDSTWAVGVLITPYGLRITGILYGYFVPCFWVFGVWCLVFCFLHSTVHQQSSPPFQPFLHIFGVLVKVDASPPVIHTYSTP
jgi:hypothetical protein